MDSVLGDKPATCPAVLIDTMVERVEENANYEAVEAADVEVREEEGDSDFESKCILIPHHHQLVQVDTKNQV